jgi:hypothetical protein
MKVYKSEDSCDFLYWCNNINCNGYHKMVIITKPYGDEFEPEACDRCGEILYSKGINSAEDSRSDLLSISFAKIGSMTPEQKKAELKKRSHQHFLKNVKEKQVEMIRRFDKTGKN